MKSLMNLSIAALFLACAVSFGKGASFQETVDYLDKNVIGKTLTGTISEDHADLKEGYDLQRDWTFADMKIGHQTIELSIVVNIKHTRYVLDDQGKRILPGKTMDRILTNRAVFKYRNMTGQFFGVLVVEGITYPRSASGSIYSGSLSLEDGKLKTEMTTVGYDEFPKSTSDTLYGLKCSIQDEMELKNDKLVRVWKNPCDEIDPATGGLLQKRPVFSIDETQK